MHVHAVLLPSGVRAAPSRSTFTFDVGASLIPVAGARLEVRTAADASSAVVLDTRLRDASGRRLVPDGPHSLQGALLAGRTVPDGCATVPIASQRLVLSARDP